MALNISQANKLFNKAGYRLLSKEIGLQVPKGSIIPNSATSYERIIVEHSSGVRKIIHSFKNNEGKIIYRQRINSNSPIFETSTYEWFAPQLRTPQTKFKEVKNPNLFTNFGLRKNTNYIDTTQQQKVVKDSYEVVDINPQSRTVTRTEATHITGEGTQTIDTTRIAEITNGKKTKEIYQKFLTGSESLPQKLESYSIGLTQAEIEQINKMEYFYAMHKTPENFIFAAKPRVLSNQGVEISLPIGITNKEMKDSAYYSKTHKHIMFSQKSINKGIKPILISTFEHEARHRYQHKLIEMLDNGLLTNPDEIKLAKAFKENIKNYINMSDDFEKYQQQLIEVDAYKVTDSVYDKYQSNVDNLCNIFTKASKKTLGE